MNKYKCMKHSILEKVKSILKIRNLIFLFSMLIITGISVAQETIYIGDNKYKATKLWGFQKNPNASGNRYVHLRIGKIENDGYIIITNTGSINPITFISIFLEDGSRIECWTIYDKEIVNDECTSVFYPRKANIESMKKSGIKSIRYTVSTNYLGSKEYTAKLYNIVFSRSSTGYKELGTEKEIRELY